MNYDNWLSYDQRYETVELPPCDFCRGHGQYPCEDCANETACEVCHDTKLVACDTCNGTGLFSFGDYHDEPPPIDSDPLTDYTQEAVIWTSLL